MAAALSASPWGPSRAGREPGKIQPLSAARVTHRARFPRQQRSGPLCPGLELGRLWDHWRDRISGCSQTPRENPLLYTPRFLSQAVMLQGTAHSIVTSSTPARTMLSALLFLSPARVSRLSPHLQALGPGPRPPLPLLQCTRHTWAGRFTRKRPPSRRSVHTPGEHPHLPTRSWQSQLCMAAHAYKHACP